MKFKDIAHRDRIPVWIFMVLGLPAGLLSSFVGAGADALLFFLVSGLYRFKPISVIPTTVAYMACCSILGTIFILLHKDIQISDFIVNSWMVAAPIVTLGAPLGGYIICRSNPAHATIFIVCIILIEALSTLLLVEITNYERIILTTLMLFVFTYLSVQFNRLINQSTLLSNECIFRPKVNADSGRT
jgi:uncharacterized membrane protein YfcA